MLRRAGILGRGRRGRADFKSGTKQDRRRSESRGRRTKRIRYAVVGLGHIAQTAVLPTFQHARKNSELAALVSGDAQKRDVLRRRYHIPEACSYEEYEELLHRGNVDAVYIATPNSEHCDLTVRAADAGVHVLCEKPLAPTEEECRRMIHACRDSGVKLMTAYRLHLERSNLEAIELIQSGKLGDLRVFNSVFSYQAKGGNIRLQSELGGGPLFDIGTYCINAARCFFRAEPVEVMALKGSSRERRFVEVEEMTGALLRFPGERLATFVCSFGAAYAAAYDLLGTEGTLHANNAYAYSGPITWELTTRGKTQTRCFPGRDQFAAELLYFSDCVLNDKDPEPSGEEGLNDVRIIAALYESVRTGKRVQLTDFCQKPWPSLKQAISCPATESPEPVRAEAPVE